MKYLTLLGTTISLTSTIWSDPVWLDAYYGDYEKVWTRTHCEYIAGKKRFEDKMYGRLMSAYACYNSGKLDDMRHIFFLIDQDIENELDKFD